MNLPVATQSPSEISRAAYELFLKHYAWEEDVRAVSIRAINLMDADVPIQLDIFSDVSDLYKIEARDRAVEQIRNIFGRDSIFCASVMTNFKMSRGEKPSRVF